MHGYNNLIQPIMKRLFEAEDRRLVTAVDTLCVQNDEAHGQKYYGFFYEGKCYRHSKSPSLNQPKTIHISLWSEIQAHLADRALIDLDKSLIQQMLFRQIDACFSYADVRDAVPDCIIDLLPDEVKSLDRCREPGFFHKHPRDMKQYAEALPRLEFYSVARLIY